MIARVTTIELINTNKQHTEEQMAAVLSKMMELERQIRIGKEAEAQLTKCRQQLVELAAEYAEGTK
jgi:hypothetical protein